MMNFASSVFGDRVRIPDSARVIFVADLFVSDYVGGAELTTQALIDSSPQETFNVHSRDVTMSLLKQGADRFWVFGNFSELDASLIPSIIANLRYSVVEYDYKYCRFRSPEKHLAEMHQQCDCDTQQHGLLVSAFYYGAMGMWWMSEAQKERYFERFPFLREKDNVVLSSVFDDKTLGYIKHLQATSTSERHGWIVLGSSSWVKGYDAAMHWVNDNQLDHEVVWNVPYDQLLARLACAEGLVYLPQGADTCPRLVIEAKLLGCKLHINENVQHQHEPWFDSTDIDTTYEYLYAARQLFWNGIRTMMDYRPTISGYITTYNCCAQQYPYMQSITSMLNFCDEVCVVDGGSTDETINQLIQLAFPSASIGDVEDVRTAYILGRRAGDSSYELPDVWHGHRRNPKLRVKIVPRDWTSKHHPVFDGMQKATARAMCTKEFCWQMDSDEVAHEDDALRIVELCRAIPRGVDILSLPVIEYWGGPDKVRLDVMPWKWRLSRNLPSITHGIPRELRRYDASGELFAAPGTDGCDMIDATTGEVLPHVSFYTAEVDQIRQSALAGNPTALVQYQEWFDQVTTGLPTVFHYSWYDLERKIRLYRDYWTQHWTQLYGDSYEGRADQNMMFDAPWSEITDEMIRDRAAQLQQIGGWIWHRRWDGSYVPWLTSSRVQPSVMS